MTDVQGCRLWVHPPDLAEMELSKAQKTLVGTGFTGPSIDSGDVQLTGEQSKQHCAGFNERQLRMLKAQIRDKRAGFHEIIDQAVNAATLSGQLSSGSFRRTGTGESHRPKCIGQAVERDCEGNVDLTIDGDTAETKHSDVVARTGYEVDLCPALIGFPIVWQ